MRAASGGFEHSPLNFICFLLVFEPFCHFKGEFRLTKRGAELAQAPALLFAELIPFFVLEADHGTTERALYEAFYGEDHDWDNAGWREMAAFSSCVMRPLEWAGLLVQTAEERDGKHLHHVFKTPLWRSALNLDTDGMLRLVLVQ